MIPKDLAQQFLDDEIDLPTLLARIPTEQQAKMIQVRTNDGGLNYFESLPAAIKWAEENDAWKVSFPVGESRCRLVKALTHARSIAWVYEPIVPSQSL